MSGIISTISSTVSKISDFFSNVGDWCVDIINGGLNVFSTLTCSSLNVLTEDSDSDTFSAFWTVINRMSSVIGVIASTLLVLLFVVNIATDAWDTRHEFDMWGFVKQVAKMLVSVVIVNNAINIVVAVFNVGARLASVILLTDSDDMNLQLSDDYATYLSYSVTGVKGVMVFLVYMIGAGVVCVCGVVVCIEIYQRVFKMYVLIPFSTLSFATFVMGDGNRGNEVFHGYFKSIVSTAAEASIIMLCVAFAASLISDTSTLNAMFPAMTGDTEERTVTYSSMDDIVALTVCFAEGSSALATVSDDLSLSDEVEEFIAGAEPGQYGIMITDDGHAFNGVSGILSQLLFGGFDADAGGTVTLYSAFTWKTVLMILLQVLFPCVLCAGAVKIAGSYSGMILGR